MRPLRNLTLLTLTVCLVLVGTACGSKKKAASSSGSSGAVAPNTIDIKNFAFGPSTVTVTSGATVTVKNDDTTDHTVTSSDNKSFDTKHVSPGSSATFTAPAAGTYTFHCNIHPSMKGTLVVK